MLLELKVSNFAIIDNVHIEFKKGLNILTGETGAGKSVLLKSLSLLMGTKGSAESIRSGFNQASIEGSFDISDRKDISQKLNDLGIENEENILIVKRIIAEDKSKVYINGSINTLNVLRDIVAPLIEVTGHAIPLIEMTGQFDNRNLISKSYHLDMLDHYSGAWEIRKKYLDFFHQWQELKNQKSELEKNDSARVQKLDYLKFQRDEIKNLNLEPFEDQILENKIKSLKNSAKFHEFIDLAENALLMDSDSAIHRITTVLKKAFDVCQNDQALATKVEPLKTAKVLIEDTLYEIRQYTDKISDSSDQLEALEKRLSDLRKLQKKFGSSIDSILQALVEIEIEINQIENADKVIQEINKKILSTEQEMKKLADQLHLKRQKTSQVLADSVNEELLDLNMKGVTFHVEVTKLDSFSSTGTSEVEFLSQTSSKDSKKPLAKFASGGELSRILLSLKRVIGTNEQPRTYLFDEVDTGVSGPTAEKVGKKLKSIAKDQQVICVTHLPQVAAFADHHLFISKNPSKKSGVTMTVSELAKDEKVSEIARLISGEKVTKTSLAHAKQLISEASP